MQQVRGVKAVHIGDEWVFVFSDPRASDPFRLGATFTAKTRDGEVRSMTVAAVGIGTVVAKAAEVAA